jgi:hypothetical protein
LPEKKPVLGKIRRPAHHNSQWLITAPCRSALFQQISIVDQTTALMGPEGAGTNQHSVSPSQCFFQRTAVALASKLGSPSVCWSQPTIEADRQDQPQNAR